MTMIKGPGLISDKQALRYNSATRNMLNVQPFPGRMECGSSRAAFHAGALARLPR